MRKLVIICILSFVVLVSVSYTKESLRDVYSRPSSQWPAPTIDNGVE